ncbi:MAG: hypothetical protein Q4P25_04265 [Tissierellia bacterium]|nr:hypothetical protein [Tissierellia bacterium]
MNFFIHPSHLMILKTNNKYSFIKTLDEFYKDYADGMYLKGDYEKSEKLWDKSKFVYEKYTGFWERSII